MGESCRNSCKSIKCYRTSPLLYKEILNSQGRFLELWFARDTLITAFIRSLFLKVVIEIARKNALQSTTNTELITVRRRWFLIRSSQMKPKHWLTRESLSILIGWSWKITVRHLLGDLFSQHSLRLSKIGTTRELTTITKLEHQRNNHRYIKIRTPINQSKSRKMVFTFRYDFKCLKEWWWLLISLEGFLSSSFKPFSSSNVVLYYAASPRWLQ